MYPSSANSKYYSKQNFTIGGYFINLNNLIADQYDRMGSNKVSILFPGDHTHTNEAGAKVNAATVVNAIKANKNLSLHNYLLR